MSENEMSGGWPIGDEELDNVVGGIRVIMTDCVKICPVCGSSDTVALSNNGACRLCRVRGCGTIFRGMDGKVVGVEPTIANQKP